MPEPQPAERAWPGPALHRSVFAKLVLVILVMALCLMSMVLGFFVFVVNPTVGSSVYYMLGDYARRIAAESPGPDKAHEIARDLDLQIRYQGPDGAWTTDERLATIPRALESTRRGESLGGSTYLVKAPSGGHYLIAWTYGRRTRAAHDKLLLFLLAAMLLVFGVAHLVLRRALRPLRALQDGVARLSAGDVDVALPNRTRDEFGALTDAFNRMAARVKEMLRARDQLLLDVSHELRSPLTRLKVALALLPASEKKTQAESDAAEMEAMIAELLELERLKDGRGLRIESANLVDLLHEAARPFQDSPPGARVTASPAEIRLDVDVEGVRTVLRNLLGNAVKYSLPDSRPIEISATLLGGALVVRVVDDGPGIPEADIPRLFEPFFRVDRSRSRKTGGYGLGLSICKRVVEAHGGNLTAANNKGRGACFTLTFPVELPPA